MTPAEMDEMERAAKAATPGPWTVEVNPSRRLDLRILNLKNDWPDRPVAWIGANQDDPVSDAAYIAAANPASVLRLIAYARRLEALLPEAWNAGCDLQERERSRWIADALARAREGSK